MDNKGKKPEGLIQRVRSYLESKGDLLGKEHDNTVYTILLFLGVLLIIYAKPIFGYLGDLYIMIVGISMDTNVRYQDDEYVLRYMKGITIFFYTIIFLWRQVFDINKIEVEEGSLAQKIRDYEFPGPVLFEKKHYIYYDLFVYTAGVLFVLFGLPLVDAIVDWYLIKYGSGSGVSVFFYLLWFAPSFLAVTSFNPLWWLILPIDLFLGWFPPVWLLLMIWAVLGARR